MPLIYFDLMQFDQKIGQYHLTGTDIAMTEGDFYEPLVVQTAWGAKIGSMNYEVLQNI